MEEQKFIIGPASVSEREFVQDVRPNGKVCLNMMWLCSNAIMRDWHSRAKIILDQTLIVSFRVISQIFIL